MVEDKEARWPFGVCVIVCIIFAILTFLQADWLMCVLFGLFAFLNVSQYFKPEPEKPYKAEFEAVV